MHLIFANKQTFFFQVNLDQIYLSIYPQPCYQTRTLVFNGSVKAGIQGHCYSPIHHPQPPQSYFPPYYIWNTPPPALARNIGTVNCEVQNHPIWM